MAGSLHREGRRSPDAPQGREAGFSESPGFPPLPGSGIPSGERDFRGKRLTVSQRDFSCWGAGFTDLRNSPSLRSGIPPPGSPGSGIFDRGAEFPRQGRGSGFFPRQGCGKQVSRISESSQKDDEAQTPRESREAGFPARVTWRAGFSRKWVSVSQRDFPRCWGAGFAGFGNSPSPGSGIPPPGSPGSGIFDRVPRRSYRGAEFSLAEVAGSGFFPCRGQVQGVKGHSILHCTP